MAPFLPMMVDSQRNQRNTLKRTLPVPHRFACPLPS
jgi:hypothetical protein